MTTKEKFAKALILAQTLINFGKQTAQEIKFEAFKIKDSDVLVEYSTLEVGAELKQSSPSGSVPAVDGKYSLENGVEIVAKDGKIESYTDAKPEPTQAEKDAALAKGVEEKMSTIYEERYTALETLVNGMVLKVDAALATIAAAPTKAEIEAFNKVAEGFKANATAIGEHIQLLASIPTEFSKREVENVPVTEGEKVNETYNAIAEYWSTQKGEQ